jgi:RNA polymerase sigma factor for flagellar operon FliA
MYPTAQVEDACLERERLILEHLPQVRLIARRIHERVPDSVSLDDLVSTGIVGLISAIDNFDPSQNVKLRTYAEYKIRGAILDSLRGLDWASRDRRRKAKQIEAAIAAAEQKASRTASEEEVASELELGLNEYRQWLVEVRGLTLNSLDYTTVLSLYYKEELTLREISEVMKLHLSRISQLKSQAILRLRTYLQKRWPLEHGR